MTKDEESKLGYEIMCEVNQLFKKRLHLFNTTIEIARVGTTILEQITVMFIDDIIMDEKPEEKIKYVDRMAETIKILLVKIHNGFFEKKH